ncbi:glycosyltransferase [Akkermansia sp.]|uniref:glycosyltransferase n=1 Tax=Akkermansia sp. TaxID=1872421 RepID=UPI00399CE80C
MTSPQRRTVFQVSHSVSASSAPYRLNDALNRNISDMESVLLLRRRKGIDGLEISRSAARRATDALRRHLAHGFDALLPEKRRDLPFSLNVLGMGFDTAQMEKADLVHLHWIGGRTVDFTRLSHIRRPLVYTLHDMFACTAGCHCTMDCDRFRDECRGSCPQLGTPRLFRGLPAWLFSRKRRSFARIPSLTLVTPSLWLKREVEKGCMFPGRRIVQIYNPVDTDLFRPAEDREAIRAALGIPSGAFVIACGATGLFNPVKGGHFIPWCWRNCTGAGTGTFICCSSATRKRTWNSPSPAQMPASLRT